MTQHPITPPPELVQQWEEDWHHSKIKHIELEPYIAAQAAQYGADQELKACCRELEYNFMPDSGSLRAARRPKPKSEKQQALEAFDRIEYAPSEAEDFATILRALKSIPDDQ